MDLENNLQTNNFTNSEQLFLRLSLVIMAQMQIETLAQMAVVTLQKQMAISKVALLIIDEHEITHAAGVGYNVNELKTHEFEELMHKMIRIGIRPLALEHLEDNSVRELFHQYQIDASIPIRVTTKEVAILLLGYKNSGEVYTERDFMIINIFAQIVGVAINNINTYNALKKLNEELEKRIAERTQELNESQKRELQKAREAMRLKDEFIFIASHELRTPITVIRGFLELISEGIGKFPKDLKQNIVAISVAADHLAQLINDLLETARSEEGTIKLNLRPHEPVTIINFAVNQITHLAKEKKIKITVKSENEYPPVLCDPGKVEEVMLNLLSNAIKYNREGGKVEVSIFPAGDFLIIEIRDTGYGIPKSQQEKIFEKFFRATAPETKQVIGAGLGLFIVRMLVEKMGGEITFSSLEHEGSTFSFSLPFATTSAPSSL